MTLLLLLTACAGTADKDPDPADSGAQAILGLRALGTSSPERWDTALGRRGSRLGSAAFAT